MLLQGTGRKISICCGISLCEHREGAGWVQVLEEEEEAQNLSPALLPHPAPARPGGLSLSSPAASRLLPLPGRVGCYQGAELQNIWKRHACICRRGAKMDALGYNKHPCICRGGENLSYLRRFWWMIFGGGFHCCLWLSVRTYNLFELGSLWKPGVILCVEIPLYSEAARSERRML